MVDLETDRGSTAGAEERVNVTPGDFVGATLGFQGSGINSSENIGANMISGILHIPSVFGFSDDPSPHSYYPCIIGCGEDNFTPKKDNYYTPDAIDGSKEHPMTQYYKDNFSKRDENNKIIIDSVTKKPIMPINLDLLKSTNSNSKKTTIDTIGNK